jgi:hypothetical protein
MKELRPLLNAISQWTQVLSSKSQVTVSLVRLAIRRLTNHVDNLRVKALLYIGDPLKKHLGEVLQRCHNSYDTQMKDYFNVQFFQFHLFMFGEFFDPRTHALVSEDEKKELIKLLEVRTLYG